MKWKWIRRIKCLFGYHGKERIFLKRTNQRIMICACSDCGRITRQSLLTHKQAKDIRKLSKFGGGFPISQN